MNCAVHTDVPAVAYCRTCGTALCAACKRDVRGVIYCENCLAQRLQDVMPPAGARPAAAAGMPAGAPVVVVPASGPNPALAAVLAAFFPFGVGAVYCAQYAKGLAHMIIFAFLVWGANSAQPDWLFGIGIAFFWVYQIVDAHRSAKAMQLGQPPPDPFGLGSAISGGTKMRAANVPMGALVLIGLGVIFLLGNLGIFELHIINRLWAPVLLLAWGVWLLARRTTSTDPNTCRCAQCRARGLGGPAFLITLGVLLLLSAVYVVSFGRTWPILLLVVGVIKVLQSNAPNTGHIEPPPPPAATGQPPAPEAPAGNMGQEVGNV